MTVARTSRGGVKPDGQLGSLALDLAEVLALQDEADARALGAQIGCVLVVDGNVLNWDGQDGCEIRGLLAAVDKFRRLYSKADES